MTRRIAFIGYDKITSLDLIGPMEAFAVANEFGGRHAYELSVLSAKGDVFRGENGVRFCADAGFAAAPALDTLIVPGGSGLRDTAISAPVVAFLKKRAANTRRVASICTGLFALAEAGLMKKRRATTHWRYAALIAQSFPDIRLDADAIYVRDGKYFSSAGISAGIDLALALIADDLGDNVSLAVARELVVYFRRPGGQSQFSEPLQFQSRGHDRFSDLTAWIVRNLHADLSVEVLAARARLGARHFSRLFAAQFGMPPARYIERLRLDEARQRLSATRQSIEAVSVAVGYASPDAFRRAFERHFGVGPLSYRKTVALKRRE
ncbi:transcriptional regulator GlxA family with amidase domain [Rhizomicrobium palustre]|uniref:Transcriptional regulator GlxA family with amidase domain n=1 Tax=Rhizomicrobium palustre TaxID=189966 RepID=A0A846N1D5_9PROT|nr:GlxA family transcriptional regulator [Rhizomicrobium palustre]NIK89042.1 transcriptional regulator GlxA family with amidase domain [Rhizomicrobium palustre]